MAFIKFTGHGRSYAAKASISRNGMLSFSDGARRRFNMDEFPLCVFYFDPDTRRIGIEFTADEKAEGARRVRLRKTGADVAAKAFVEYFNIGVQETMVFPVASDEWTGYAVIDLDAGKRRATKKTTEEPIVA